MTTIGLKIKRVLDYLDKILPNAHCELNYNKDYELLIAIMLSAQTTDKRVNEVTDKLFKKYKSLDRLSEANIDDLKEIIYPLGTYTKKSLNVKNIALKLKNIGYVPNDRKFLESLDGVGRKSTNLALSILYNEACFAVDTHVERITKRLGLVNKNDNVLAIEKKMLKKIPAYRVGKAHHQFVLFGRYYCKAKNPLCDDCELKDICKHKST